MPRLPNLVRLHREGQSDVLSEALRKQAEVIVRTSSLWPSEWDDAIARLVEEGFRVVEAASTEGLEGVVNLRMRSRLVDIQREVNRRTRNEVPVFGMTTPENEDDGGIWDSNTPTVPSPEDEHIERETRAEQQEQASELVKALFAAEWLSHTEKRVLHDLYVNGEDGCAVRLDISGDNLRKVRQRIREKMKERGLTPADVVHHPKDAA